MLLVRESIFVGWGFTFPIVVVPRYKLSLCHILIKLDLLGFLGIGVFAWPCDHEVRIIWYLSLAPLIRLYPSEIFVSCCFRKNSIVSNFFFSWFGSISEKKKIPFGSWPKYINGIKKKKKKKKKKVVQKGIYLFPPQKTKQSKIWPNQLGMSSNLILLLRGP